MDFQKAWRKIESAKKIALITHDNPDGDTLGSALAMLKTIHTMGSHATTVNFSKELPKKYDFLYGFEKIKSSMPIHCDLQIYFDCSDSKRVSRPKEPITTINIDHHQSNTYFGDINLVLPEAPSTTAVVYKLLFENGIKIDRESADALYCGLLTDSGFFSYERVDSNTFEMARDLVASGASPHQVASNLKNREPLSRIRLLALVLESLELNLDAKVATIYLTKEMLDKSGATQDMAEDFVNYALSLHTVEAAIFIRELGSTKSRVSLRTKKRLNADKILKKIGGGGHQRAAGVLLEQNYERVKIKVLESIQGEINEK